MESFIFVLIIAGLIGVFTFISLVLSRKNLKLIFVSPGLLTLVTLVFVYLTATNDSWVALRSFIFTITGSIASINLWTVTLILYFKRKRT